MLSEALASVLRSGREHFNAEFASARRRHPELDAEAFSTFLRSSVDALVQAAAHSTPERVGDVVMATYEVGLELVALRLVGPSARSNVLDALFERVLPTAAHLVAQDPWLVLTSLCNGAHQLLSTPGARPELWLELLARLAPHAKNADTWLKVGQVGAWRAGLAHYRESALKVADSLPQELALAAVGANGTSAWSSVRRALGDDPWYDPAQGPRPARWERIVGKFSGFGGPFVEPPKVMRANGHFVLTSGGDAWLMTADAFGTTLHRAQPDDVHGGRVETRLPAGVEIHERGLSLHGADIELPLVGGITSAAYDDCTIALTCPLSHVALIVAWKRP